MKLPVFAILTGSPDFVALCGFRVYGFGHQPQTSGPTTSSYVTFQIIDGVPENYQSEAPGIDDFRIQIDVWARTPEDAQDIGEAARDALQDYGHIVLYTGGSFEPDTKLFRWSFDWQFWDKREETIDILQDPQGNPITGADGSTITVTVAA